MKPGNEPVLKPTLSHDFALPLQEFLEIRTILGERNGVCLLGTERENKEVGEASGAGRAAAHQPLHLTVLGLLCGQGQTLLQGQERQLCLCASCWAGCN